MLKELEKHGFDKEDFVIIDGKAILKEVEIVATLKPEDDFDEFVENLGKKLKGENERTQ